MKQISNRVRPLCVHPTDNRSLDLAGGDILGNHSLCRFDGIGIVPKSEGSILVYKARKDIESGRLTLPCELFYKARDRYTYPLAVEYFEDIEVDTKRTLDKLYDKGCRNIAFYGGDVINCPEKVAILECVETVLFWLESHKDAKVTLVDLHDGYYKAVGPSIHNRVGDEVTLDKAGVDGRCSHTGTVIYVDTKHTIVKFSYDNGFDANILNRKGISYETVKRISHKEFEHNEFDRFVDLKDSDSLSIISSIDWLEWDDIDEDDTKSYLDNSFQTDLRYWFDVEERSSFPYNAPIVLMPSVRRKRSMKVSDKNKYAAAMFFASVVPQAIAKVTEDINGMFAFCAINNLPLVSCGLGGFMSPYTVLCESDLIPKEEDKKEFEKDLWCMFPAFVQMLKDSIIEDILDTDKSQHDLFTITKGHIKDIVAEIGNYITLFLNDRAKEPYYIPTEIFDQL